MIHAFICVPLWFLCFAPWPASAGLAPETSQPPPPAIRDKVGIDQKLDAALPLDTIFRDEAGRDVTLGSLLRDKPVVLSLVYYQCPMLCTLALNGQLQAYRGINLQIGRDFDVITISFDPREGPELAAAKKKNYLDQYARDSAEEGWHFLTGTQASIDAIAAAVGFRYTWDEYSQQFAHSTAMILLTPQGHVSRYLYGLEYAPKDLRLGLVEASQNRIGSLADQVLLLCYHYDPLTGRYGFAVRSALRIGAVLTIAALGGFMLISYRRHRAQKLTTDHGQRTTD